MGNAIGCGLFADVGVDVGEGEKGGPAQRVLGVREGCIEVDVVPEAGHQELLLEVQTDAVVNQAQTHV